MSLQYIIDGYNITNHHIFIQNITDNIRDRRLFLVEFIKVNRLCGSQRNNAMLIFDGYPDSAMQDMSEDNIKVVFCRKESADERIKAIIKEYASASPKNFVVVTDDKEVRLFAKAYGTMVASVEEFIGSKSRQNARAKVRDSLKPDITYTQMEKINKELRKIWLK